MDRLLSIVLVCALEHNLKESNPLLSSHSSIVYLKSLLIVSNKNLYNDLSRQETTKCEVFREI